MPRPLPGLRQIFWFVLLMPLLPTGCAPDESTQQPAAPAGPPLVTGRYISPHVQAQQNVGSMPMNIVFSPEGGKFLITTDIGNRQALWAIRADDGAGISHVDFSTKPVAAKSTDKKAAEKKSPIEKSTGEKSTATPPAEKQITNGEAAEETTSAGSAKSNGLYYGLAFAKSRAEPAESPFVLYAAQGGHDSIAVLTLSGDGKLKLVDTIPTRAKDFPAGLATDNRCFLYITNNASGAGDPFKLSGSIAIYNQKQELGRYTFSASHGGTSNFPLAVCVLADGSKAFVASERDNCLYVIDSKDAANPKLAATVPTGAHPVAVLLTKDEKKLYVANSLGDTISVVDTASDKVIDTIMLRPAAVRDVPGVTPTGLALSPDEKTLYVTLGDMNAIALIDMADAKVEGYIPTGWYPSAVAAAADGKRLFVVNAKGNSPRNPNNMPDKYDAKRSHAYILSILEGNVGVVEIPGEKELEETTKQVLKNNRLDGLAQSAENPLAAIGRAAGKIQHVFYIIKENRTYDEVLGDIPAGNGDPSLVLYGREITPNQHALAERFVLLDNLYACGEVSGDGWVWSTQGMADAYVIRNVPYNYSGRGRKFDFEGENNGYPSGGLPGKGEDGKPLAEKAPFNKATPPISDVANTGRNIWDAAKDAGVSLRNYGFFLYFADGNVGLVGGPDNYPVATGLQPPGHDLAGVTDIDYRRFDLDYPDSDAPNTYFKQTNDAKFLYERKTYGKYEMPSRFAEWNREFQMMLAKDSAGSAVPALSLIRLPLDHTEAARAGKHTPRAYIADNDYAVGQIVDAIAHSSIWQTSAIFIIEDDAQSGADHVDCHRTIAYVVSPWIKAHSIDHRFYNTDSMLKTMELLLGIKPLSQYDLVADPILDFDTAPANAETFSAILPSPEIIGQLNPTIAELPTGDPRRELAEASAKMDFSHADNVPSLVLNNINWQLVKGIGTKMPAPRGIATDDDDDDDK
jgi:YVTN family beta-propeller protein